MTLSMVKLNQETNLTPYMLFFAGLRSPLTVEAYKLDLTQYLEFLERHHQGIKPEEAEEKHLVSFITSLKVKNASKRTINRKISFLKKFYMWMMRHYGLMINPTMWLTTMKIPSETVETREINPLNVRKLLSKYKVTNYTSAMHKALVVTLLYTGMRVSEVLSLKMGSIYRSGIHWVFEWTAKNNKKMVMPIRREVMDAIRVLMKWSNKAGLGINGNSYLFRATPTKTSSLVKAIGRNQAYTIFREAFEAIGVDGVSPHSARVTVITQLVASGEPLQGVADAVGHSSIAMTRAYAKKRNVIGNNPILRLSY